MHEHVAPALYYLEVHILYASVACLAAWVLTSLWKGGDTAKYWIWVVTSVNFMVPFAGFFNGFGSSHLSWATQLGGLDTVGFEVSRNPSAGAVLLGVWACGAAFMAARLLLRLPRDRGSQRTRGDRNATPFRRRLLTRGVPVSLSAAGQGPSVEGVLRPRITLPPGIDDLLTERELDAVLIHEVTHARRRDNLVALIHEIALCGLWFNPLMWLAGSRLALFRELSCDEAVIQSSRGPDLLTALAKLADPGESRLLSAGAATLFSHRLARLQASQPRRASRPAILALVGLFAAVVLAGIVETIAHTSCCFNFPV
ncbi:MAG TPA: M56 family metallopeptidase [Steroidobacteraceae bacterium]|jgi:beta-lactamase regulating signal transducer with metallopeptidase domain|nr:M56 family metallopeptidase [Steroidobacteraceae bacterium]